MAFETFPLPDPGTAIGELDGRVAQQTAAITPVLTALYGALDGRLSAQQGALNKVGAKLTRALNGRIRAQGAAVSPVVGGMLAALDQQIAGQGNSLALQSAVLSRLAATSPPPASSLPPTTPGAAPPPTPSGVGGATPVTPTVPILPPGVSAPSFSLSPQEVLPSSTGPGGTVAYLNPRGSFMWVANCDTHLPEILERGSDYAAGLVARGHYLPLRYNVSADPDLLQTWLHNYAPNAVATACHAYFNGGDQWPRNGDFTEMIGDGAVIGEPVGPWPFSSDGAYHGP